MIGCVSYGVKSLMADPGSKKIKNSEVEMLEKTWDTLCIVWMGLLICVMCLLTVLLTVGFYKEQARMDERMLLERHHEEITIPLMIRERVPFIPQFMLRGEPSTYSSK